MSNFEEAITIYTNFITPPDFLDEPNKHTVLMIDVGEPDVESLAFWCKEKAMDSFNVYLYNYTMTDGTWLLEAIKRADSIIVNTDETAISSTKLRVIEMSKSYYYGPAQAIDNKNMLRTPLEYFINYQKGK